MKINSRTAFLFASLLVIGVAVFTTFRFLYRTGLLRELDQLVGTIALVLLPFALFVLLLYIYIYYGFGPQEGIYRSNPQENMVALTFDDGPSPIYTTKILAILREKRVKGTF